jgi:hypothetical protein
MLIVIMLCVNMLSVGMLRVIISCGTVIFDIYRIKHQLSTLLTEGGGSVSVKLFMNEVKGIQRA